MIDEHIFAILLGIVQGITEFLPVSSSGHLIIFSWFLNGEPIPMELNVALHFGTVLSVLVFFYKDWLRIIYGNYSFIIKKQTKAKKYNHLLLCLFIGSIPAGILGITFKKSIENIFHNPQAVIFPLALVGFLLWWADKTSISRKNMFDLSKRDALLVGVAQALALVPGVSRSGATIMAGRFLKLSRQEAAKFSFLLGTPAMLGALILHMNDLIISIQKPLFYLGIIISFISGIFAIKWLLIIIERYGFLPFALYRFLLSLIITYLFLF